MSVQVGLAAQSEFEERETFLQNLIELLPVGIIIVEIPCPLLADDEAEIYLAVP